MDETTREVWAKRIERWRASGVSLKEFAAESGLSTKSLAWWRWRLGGGQPSKAKRATPPKPPTKAKPPAAAPPKRRRPSRAALAVAKSSALSFVEVTRAVVDEPLEVVLPSELRVRVPAGFDPKTLIRLLDTLEGRR